MLVSASRSSAYASFADCSSTCVLRRSRRARCSESRNAPCCPSWSSASATASSRRATRAALRSSVVSSCTTRSPAATKALLRTSTDSMAPSSGEVTTAGSRAMTSAGASALIRTGKNIRPTRRTEVRRVTHRRAKTPQSIRTPRRARHRLRAWPNVILKCARTVSSRSRQGSARASTSNPCCPSTASRNGTMRSAEGANARQSSRRAPVRSVLWIALPPAGAFTNSSWRAIPSTHWT